MRFVVFAVALLASSHLWFLALHFHECCQHAYESTARLRADDNALGALTPTPFFPSTLVLPTKCSRLHLRAVCEPEALQGRVFVANPGPIAKRTADSALAFTRRTLAHLDCAPEARFGVAIQGLRTRTWDMIE